MFYTGVSPDYPWIYNQIIRELQVKRVNYEDITSLYMHHILTTINRYIKEGRETKSDTINDIEKAAHYFKDNFNKVISVKEYAREHLMSTNHFIHSFKSVMKVSPMQFIINLRILAAKGYLEGGDKNIGEIAREVGYNNALYFTRLFKRHTGMTPTEYRNNKR